MIFERAMMYFLHTPYSIYVKIVVNTVTLWGCFWRLTPELFTGGMRPETQAEAEPHFHCKWTSQNIRAPIMDPK